MSATISEIAPAKLNLALHVRGKLPDGRHSLETIFAFCTDGDRLRARTSSDLLVRVSGPFGSDIDIIDARGHPKPNLVLRAASFLRKAANTEAGAVFDLEKNLPVAAGVGGGSADAGAALRLLTSLWQIDPALAQAVAPKVGSDVPACLLSIPVRGDAAGDQLTAIALPEVSGTPVLLVNPRLPLATPDVFARWDGVDRGPLADWREGRNDLEAPAQALVPQIGEVLSWLSDQSGVTFVRMSGSGATCFALFESEDARDLAAAAVPPEWWRLATFLR